MFFSFDLQSVVFAEEGIITEPQEDFAEQALSESEPLASAKDGAYKNIKTISGEDMLSYINTHLSSGKTYFYKIVLYRTASGNKVKGIAAGSVMGKTT